MKALKTLAAGILSLGLTGGAAQAITFDFTGLEGTPSTTLFEVGPIEGVSLDVTAATLAFPGGVPTIVDDASVVTFPVTGGFPVDGEGIGVSDIADTNDDVDGFGDNDVLIFTFSQTVEFGTIGFENVDFAGDDDEFFVLDLSDGIIDVITGGGTNIIGTGFDTGENTVGPVRGTIFAVGAIDANDDFLISDITVAAVPLPAAAPLLAGGIALFGFVGWRRKRAAQAA